MSLQMALERRIGREEIYDLMQLPIICATFRRVFFAGIFVVLLGTASAQQAPLRVAIVGLVHGHVEGFLSAMPQHKDVELVGITDPNPALATKYATKYRLTPSLFFTDLEALISVMVEKPLTISLDDTLAIREIARKDHIHVLVNYETTWYGSNRAAYQESENGRLGAIRRVVIHDGHQGPSEIGVPPEFLSWLTDPDKNGAGALYDFGCYGVDLMTWLMHGETPLTVTAVVNHDKPQLYPHVDDDATIVLGYPQAQAVIQASWNWPFGRKDMEVYGATGYAITVGADKLRVRHEHDSEEQMTTTNSLPPMERDSLSYLTAVLRGQIEPKGDLTALDTNVVVMQILDAARESARIGKTIPLTSLPE